MAAALLRSSRHKHHELHDAVSQEGGPGTTLCQSEASRDEKEGNKIRWTRATVSPNGHTPSFEQGPTREIAVISPWTPEPSNIERAAGGFSERLQRSMTTSIAAVPCQQDPSLFHLLPYLLISNYLGRHTV